MQTKDLRKFKFRFENAIEYHKAIDFFNNRVQITKIKKFFVFSYRKGLSQIPGFDHNLMMNERVML